MSSIINLSILLTESNVKPTIFTSKKDSFFNLQINIFNSRTSPPSN